MDKAFKAISDNTRRLIIAELSERNTQTLYELCARLITKHQLTISRQGITKHIKILEDAGIVTFERKGKYQLLHFNDTPLKEVATEWFPKVVS